MEIYCNVVEISKDCTRIMQIDEYWIRVASNTDKLVAINEILIWNLETELPCNPWGFHMGLTQAEWLAPIPRRPREGALMCA